MTSVIRNRCLILPRRKRVKDQSSATEDQCSTAEDNSFKVVRIRATIIVKVTISHILWHSVLSSYFSKTYRIYGCEF